MAHTYHCHFGKSILWPWCLLILESFPTQGGRGLGAIHSPHIFSPYRADSLSTWPCKTWLKPGWVPIGWQHRGLASSAHFFSSCLQTLAQLQRAQLKCPGCGIHEPAWKTWSSVGEWVRQYKHHLKWLWGLCLFLRLILPLLKGLWWSPARMKVA